MDDLGGKPTIFGNTYVEDMTNWFPFLFKEIMKSSPDFRNRNWEHQLSRYRQLIGVSWGIQVVFSQLVSWWLFGGFCWFFGYLGSPKMIPAGIVTNRTRFRPKNQQWKPPSWHNLDLQHFVDGRSKIMRIAIRHWAQPGPGLLREMQGFGWLGCVRRAIPGRKDR